MSTGEPFGERNIHGAETWIAPQPPAFESPRRDLQPKTPEKQPGDEQRCQELLTRLQIQKNARNLSENARRAYPPLSSAEAQELLNLLQRLQIEASPEEVALLQGKLNRPEAKKPKSENELQKETQDQFLVEKKDRGEPLSAEERIYVLQRAIQEVLADPNLRPDRWGGDITRATRFLGARMSAQDIQALTNEDVWGVRDRFNDHQVHWTYLDGLLNQINRSDLTTKKSPRNPELKNIVPSPKEPPAPAEPTGWFGKFKQKFFG